MKKMLVISALFLLMVTSLVSAITISPEAKTNIVVPELNLPAEFTLTISGAPAGDYNIYTLTDVSIKPTSPFSLGEGTNNVDIFVYPSKTLDERGLYTFTYNVKKTDGLNFEDRLTVKIVDLDNLLEISSDTLNTTTGDLTFYVRNKENIQINNLKVHFESALFDFDKTISLAPNERLDITVDKDADALKKIRAGSYVVKANIETVTGNQVVEGKIYIGETKNIISSQTSTGFIIYTDTFSKVNKGNVPEVVTITFRKNIISRIFAGFNVEPVSVERSGFFVEYIWTQKLEPSESLIVKVRTNYILPVLIIILALIAIFVFKRYSETSIEVKKSVSHIKTKGGEFALRVRISVKAKGKVNNVSIMDKIPAIVKVYEKFGTIRPDKIDSKNRRLQWNLGNLEAKEERLLSYVIYSKVGVVGKFSLPEALAVFEKDNKMHEVASNEVFFLSEQVSSND